jgi:hypothetical protein
MGIQWLSDDSDPKRRQRTVPILSNRLTTPVSDMRREPSHNLRTGKSSMVKAVALTVVCAMSQCLKTVSQTLMFA